jgi:sirohydrochlorin cobaltochelatase
MNISPASERNPRRAVVLVGHGGVPRDYPRDRLLRLRALEAQRRTSGGRLSAEEVALDTDLRRWPRTSATDPYQARLERVAMHLRLRLAPTRLALAHNEFCAPTLPEAIRALAADGVTDIVAVPSMLTPGGAHTELEIPESIDAVRAEFPHLDICYAWPFAAEHLAGFFVEHLLQFDFPKDRG